MPKVVCWRRCFCLLYFVELPQSSQLWLPHRSWYETSHHQWSRVRPNEESSNYKCMKIIWWKIRQTDRNRTYEMLFYSITWENTVVKILKFVYGNSLSISWLYSWMCVIIIFNINYFFLSNKLFYGILINRWSNYQTLYISY